MIQCKQIESNYSLQQNILKSEKSEQRVTQYQVEREGERVKLQDLIAQYNNFITGYLSENDLLTELQVSMSQQRKQAIKDVFMMFQIYHVSYIKNIEYDLKAITQKLEGFKIEMKPEPSVADPAHQASQLKLEPINLEEYTNHIESDYVNKLMYEKMVQRTQMEQKSSSQQRCQKQ